MSTLMKRTSITKSKRKRGRPKLLLSRTTLRCTCGGKTGVTVCKMPVHCNKCNLCFKGCRANLDCDALYIQEPVTEMNLRKRNKVEYFVEDVEESPTKIVTTQVNDIVHHRNLALPSATVTDLAKFRG